MVLGLRLRNRRDEHELRNSMKTRTLAIFAILFLLLAGQAWATTYYVDSALTDTNVGSATPDCTTYNPVTFLCSGGSYSAYKTIADVNSKALSPDDQMLFRKGQIWRETLTVPSSGTNGHNIIYGAFGNGSNPVLSGMDLITGFANAGSSTWTVALATNPSGGVMFNNQYGTSSAIVPIAYLYSWSWAANVLTIFSASDPASAYTSPGIGNCTRAYNIDGNFKNYVTYQDLTLSYAAAQNLKWTAVTGCILQRCTLTGSHTQALNWYTSGTSRSDNNIVQYNKIYNSRTHGITMGILSTYGTGNFISYNQIYQNSGDGIQITATQTGQNNYIYNNDFIANRVWGVENTVAMTGWTIKNNLFHHNGIGDFTAPATSTLTYSNNLFYRDDAQTSVSYNGSTYTSGQIASWDATSIGSNAFPSASAILSKNFSRAWFADSKTIYAGDSNSRIWKSLDTGSTWTLMNTWTTSTLFSCVWVAPNGYVYASLIGSITAPERGLFRSPDGGVTWARTLDLSAFTNSVGVWAIDSDSTGTIYAGIYSAVTTSNDAYIYKSINNGASWVQVYYDASARHIHQIKVDPKNNYIYAAVGDGGTPWFTQKIIRSVDGGQNWTIITPDSTTWSVVGIAITPTARIFVTESGYVLRTTDDSIFGTQYYDQLSASHAGFYLVQYDSATQALFAVSTTSTLTSYGFPMIVSYDDGVTWAEVRFQQVPGTTYQGTTYISNILGRNMIYTIQANNVMQNSVLTDITSGLLSRNFQLQPASPAPGAGMNVGLTSDYDNKAIPTRNNNYPIGAYGFIRPILINGRLMPGR